MILIEIKTDTREEAQEARTVLLSAVPALRLRPPIHRPPSFYIIRGWLTQDDLPEEDRTPTTKDTRDAQSAKE